MKKAAVLLLLILLVKTNGFGQNVQVKALIDTNNVLIGDQIKFILRFQSDKKTNVVFPAVPDSIGKLQFLSKSGLDTAQINGKYTLTRTFVLSSFDSGNFVIPSFTFMYEKPGISTLFPAATDSIIVRFNTIPVDTNKPIKDIKPPYEIPLTFWDYFKYIVIVFTAAMIALIGWFLWKRFRRKPVEELDYDPKIPPHIIALEALKQLDNEKLWQHGQTKLYYVRLTEIIRKYMERRFKLPALEMTADEIVDGLKEIGFGEQITNMMRRVFELADLAKFAKFQPFPDENALAMNYSQEFVNRTIPEEFRNQGNITGEAAK